MHKFFLAALAGTALCSGSIKADELQIIEEASNKSNVVRPPMNEIIADALNQHLKLEMESSYLYLGMSTYFAEQNLDGFAHWFQLHSQEEFEHAMKVHNFMLQRGVPINLPELEAPSTEWDSPTAVLEASLAHEIYVSQTIKSMYGLALGLKEYDAAQFTLWFIKEQVEEEDLFESILNRLYLIEDQNSTALMLLDIEMGKREG